MTGNVFTPIEMIEKLVGFDTTSRNSNLDLIDFVADYLDAHGITSVRTFDDEKGKANLFASLGPEQPGGVVLSGHTDVVPVDGPGEEAIWARRRGYEKLHRHSPGAGA